MTSIQVLRAPAAFIRRVETIGKGKYQGQETEFRPIGRLLIFSHGNQ
jgi:hypothetical protein